jgi:hypothetical protein
MLMRAVCFALTAPLAASAALAGEPAQWSAPAPRPLAWSMPAEPDSVQPAVRWAPVVRASGAPVPRPADDLPAPRRLPTGAPPLPIGPAGEELLPPPRPVPFAARPPLPPPSPDVEGLRQEMERLRSAREALRKEQSAALAAPARPAGGETSAQLRVRIAEMLAELHSARARKAAPPPPPVVAPPVTRPPEAPKTEAPKTEGPKTEAPARPSHSPTPAAPGALTESPVDPVSLAQALFRANDFAGALEAYRALAQTEQLPEDRLTTQFMTATCLRKLGKMQEATALYREVANSSGPPVLVENAQWHLQAIKARQGLEEELQRARARRQELTRRAP